MSSRKRRDPESRRKLKVLSAKFFNREPTIVGRELLGKLLVRRHGRELLMGRMVETGACLGESDPAAHAYGGRTPRNAVLFGPPGVAYVYFIYGIHFCLNVSCSSGSIQEAWGCFASLHFAQHDTSDGAYPIGTNERRSETREAP